MEVDHFYTAILAVGPYVPGCLKFVWQARRIGQSAWTTLDTTLLPVLVWRWRSAGYFENRVVVVSAVGAEIAPPITDPHLEVDFPTGSAIAADFQVRKLAARAWLMELSVSNEQKVREVGFWITLDTCPFPGDFAQNPIPAKQGNPVASNGSQGAPTIELRPKPPDSSENPPVDGCATYVVASFHTHTPRTWLLPKGRPAPVGPSQQDVDADNSVKIPGLVYDYSPVSGNAVPAGNPADSPAQLYVDTRGPERRETPGRP